MYRLLLTGPVASDTISGVEPVLACNLLSKVEVLAMSVWVWLYVKGLKKDDYQKEKHEQHFYSWQYQYIE